MLNMIWWRYMYIVFIGSSLQEEEYIFVLIWPKASYMCSYLHVLQDQTLNEDPKMLYIFGHALSGTPIPTEPKPQIQCTCTCTKEPSLENDFIFGKHCWICYTYIVCNHKHKGTSMINFVNESSWWTWENCLSWQATHDIMVDRRPHL